MMVASEGVTSVVAVMMSSLAQPCWCSRRAFVEVDVREDRLAHVKPDVEVRKSGGVRRALCC